MSEYYSKYLKYKNKYLQLKTQVGGANPELDKFYADSKSKAIDYVQRQRTLGKKIMLIINSIPSEQSKYIIPTDHVPVYLQHRRDPEPSDLRNFPRAKTESFDTYPVFFGNIGTINDPNLKFNIIIFGKNKCGLISEFNSTTLTNLFNLTFDNQSILVLDRENPLKAFGDSSTYNILPDFNANSLFLLKTITSNLPYYTYSIDPKNIIDKLTAWFNRYLPGKLNYDSKALGQNVNNKVPTFIEPCYFNVMLQEEISNATTNTVIFYNNNLFYSNNSIETPGFQQNLQARGVRGNYLYMYFVNTKK